MWGFNERITTTIEISLQIATAYAGQGKMPCLRYLPTIAASTFMCE